MAMPCVHAVGAINSAGFAIEDYVGSYYLASTLRNTYQGEVLMISSVDIAEAHAEVVLPPVVERRPGRPKKRRVRSSTEEDKRTLSCSQCSGTGHNKRTCNK
ncbi:uncharacterized protein TRIADDRAFT_62922 [Trichoplax adhaerens]|uniref:CCHC-type domain-containing protein n=1 Tax=Trichoplax adhaerens TaxID=10228 RepID=B3SFC2_TRIAD|nr:hypothetical protein TRIADDRAFT_62922 [Trichoplax adhaerens]EDV18573.1 hypothetical protein TRIADDRAFT_62922 [Trichoplax adhaerens]|eukprot:XP_002118941.1 hypothetical protein TRIADDRAFT_62922 [Trichoplax adhaerens]